MQNRYLDFLTDSSFQGANRLFVLSFENDEDWESYKINYLPTIEIKNDNVMIDWRNFFEETVKNNLRTYNNVRKIVTGQDDDCTTGCLLDYPYFKEHYKLIARDSSRKTKIRCWSKSNTTNYFYWKSIKKWNNIFHYWWREGNSFRFFKGNIESIMISFRFNKILIKNNSI